MPHDTSEPLNPRTSGRLAIELTDLTKSYGTTRAVDAINVSVTSGEVVALLGPNGAGKSTTIDMLLGLTKPDAGSVRVFGEAPGDAISRGWVGAMLQTGGLPQHLSVRELIDMMASLYPAPTPVEEILRTAGLEGVAKQAADHLSGGQRQRVRFAIALVSRPNLLVLDEPTVSLDVDARHEFWEAVRGIARTGTTVVFATHYLEEADAFADRIMLMARGKVVADGPATEIKSVVHRRTIRATLNDPNLAELGALPGVAGAEARGDSVLLVCTDSDAAVRGLLAAYPSVRDLEITGAGLEEAFRQLTADPVEVHS